MAVCSSDKQKSQFKTKQQKAGKSVALSSEILSHIENVAGANDTNVEEVNALAGYSNNVMQLQLDDGRKIMVKQGRFDWAGPRFKSARRASNLLQKHSSIMAPNHISVHEVADAPTIAYWYLPHPTLKEVWPELTTSQKKQAAVSLGHLLKETHSLTLANYGLIHDESAYTTASAFMIDELDNRLKPTISAKWPEMLPVLYQLIDTARDMSDEQKNAVFVHNDVHLENILCKIEGGDIECVGLLDLEEARGSRWESDLASAITLHHPLFDREGEREDWLENFGDLIADGYGREPDPELLCFFRVYHLLNLGIFSVMNEEKKHARWVGETASNILNEAY